MGTDDVAKYQSSNTCTQIENRISGVMVSVLTSSAVEREFYTIGISCFSTKRTALRSKSKDWLAQNQNDVSEWSDMSTRGLLFQ
jgi:hypothetical protein